MIAIDSLWKRLGDREIFKLRVAVCLPICFFVIFLEYVYTQKGQADLAAKKKELNELQLLTKEYVELLGKIDPMERRLSASESDSISDVVQDIISKIRLKSKVASIRYLDVKPMQGYHSSGVEVKLESLTPNQVLNVVYLVDTDPRLLLVNDFILKLDFENPNTFNMTIRVALVSKK